MCLGAIYWARVARVYFAGTQQDAAAAGFDDSFIYDQIALPPGARGIPMLHAPDDQATSPFEEWKRKGDKVTY